jgi:hypothetical protein
MSLQSKEETMLKKISLWALVAFVAAGSSLAKSGTAELAHTTAGKRAPETWLLKLWQLHPGGAVTRETVNGFASRRDCTDYGTRYQAIEVRWQVEYLCEAEFRPDSRLPAQAFLKEIVTWLAANFDLLATENLPQVEFASPLKLVTMRYKGKLPEGWREDSILDPKVLAAVHREVVAVYNNATRTIYLPEGWTGGTAAEQSVLVHEMVHHLQNLGGIRYECAAAREKAAYAAQREWLARHNLDLETEFGIDMLSVLVSSACMN